MSEPAVSHSIAAVCMHPHPYSITHSIARQPSSCGSTRRQFRPSAQARSSTLCLTTPGGSMTTRLTSLGSSSRPLNWEWYVSSMKHRTVTLLDGIRTARNVYKELTRLRRRCVHLNPTSCPCPSDSSHGVPETRYCPRRLRRRDHPHGRPRPRGPGQVRRKDAHSYSPMD